jgi:hypothetical protein
MIEYVRQEPEDETLDIALQLAKRSLSEAQISKFENYIREIFGLAHFKR